MSRPFIVLPGTWLWSLSASWSLTVGCPYPYFCWHELYHRFCHEELRPSETMSQNKYFPVRRIFFGRHFGHSDAKKKNIAIISRKRKKLVPRVGSLVWPYLTMWLLGLWTSLWEEHFPDGHWSKPRFFFLKQLLMIETVEVTCQLDRIWYHPRDGWCLGMSVEYYPYGNLCGKNQPLSGPVHWSGSWTVSGWAEHRHSWLSSF